MKGTVIGILILFVFFIIIYYAFPGVIYDVLIKLERKYAGLSWKSIQLDNYTIAYLEGGEGETILLLHGFNANKDRWNRFATYLTPFSHVVAIDLPGFGESSRIETESYSISAQVSRLRKITDALRLNRFHIVGNSMGGMIAAKYTIDFSEKVISLALFDTGGILGPKKSELISQLEAGKNPFLEVENGKDFDTFLKLVFVKPPWIPGTLKKYMIRENLLRRGLNRKVFNDLMVERYFLEPELSRIGVKTLILWGDHDRLFDVSCAQILESGLSDHETVIIKDCGHCPMIERPRETADHYLEFLKGIYG